MRIGEIIKKLRGKMTQVELAKRSGLNFATISKIEKGSLTGTLTTHQKIANALNLSLPDLYKELAEPSLSVFEVNKTKAPSSDLFYYDDKVASQILVQRICERKMSPELLRLGKGGQTHLEQKPRGTEQFIFVLDGLIEIRIAESTQQLKKNQSIYFDASKPHIIKNISKTPAKCLRVSSPGTL